MTKQLRDTTKKSFRQAMRTFQTAAGSVNAYQKFLAEKKLGTMAIRTEADFRLLPVTDKNNYIRRFPLRELVPGGRLPAVAYASSGSTGKPSFWGRNDLQEQYAARFHADILRYFNIQKKQPTLVLICFSMGIWVAGNSEFFAFRDSSKFGYNVTTVTPGIDKDNCKHVLTDLAPQFQHVVIAGYPPFVRRLLEDCKQENVPLPPRLHIATSGDSCSEGWRDEVMDVAHIKNPESVINIYGCADAGFLGSETPASITLRRAAAKHPGLFADLFGQATAVPALMQYDPSCVYIEQNGPELLFTINAGIPLVRYNLHDVGTVIPFAEAHRTAKKYALTLPKNSPNLPFVAKFGRTDVAVTFFALNIFPNHLQEPLSADPLRSSVSGNVVAYTREGVRGKKHTLHVAVELAPGKKPSQQLASRIRDALVRHWLSHNMEYQKLHQTIAQEALPVVSLVRPGRLPKVQYGLLIEHGKKPKLICP